MDSLASFSERYIYPFWWLAGMALWLGVVVWAFRSANKKRFERDALIPFEPSKGGDSKRKGSQHGR